MITIKDKELEKVKIPLNSVYTPVIPCVLDGNLSFLEMVWKLLYHINVIVDAVNANHGDIEDLAQAINDLIVDKLSVMWVEVDFTARPIKANKTFAEIAEGMRKGIVFLTIKNEDEILIFIPIYSSNSAINFLRIDAKNEVVVSIRPDESVTLYQYSFATEDHPTTFQAQVTFNNTVDFNKFTEFAETTRFYKLITADSGITVPTATAASARTFAANLEYVGNACSETLTAAKNYTDTKCGETLTAANAYTDTVCSKTLAAAKTYADTQDTAMLTAAKEYTDKQDAAVQKAATIYTNTKCGETLAAAKTYADTQDETTLTSAKTYTDSKFAHVGIVKKVDGSLTADSTFSIIYLNITRGAVVDVNFSSENNRNSVYIMRNTIITPTKLTFIGYDETATIHICTIDSDNNITYA
nr:MAG: hypothetical protein [Bacteriophage sp.]